jgi:hypothetical protein
MIRTKVMKNLKLNSIATSGRVRRLLRLSPWLQTFKACDVAPAYVCYHETVGITVLCKPLHAQKHGRIEFLQPNPAVAANALLQIGATVISALLSLVEHMSQTDTCCFPKCYHLVYC